MEVAKVNAHYQVTIPKSVRQKAKVRKGSYVKVVLRLDGNAERKEEHAKSKTQHSFFS
jgi:AbrB family looped-hinge helix DNA binding protein